MKEITTIVYNFEELSDTAKDVAREWYRQAMAKDPFEYDYVIEDAKEIGGLMGIEIKDIYWQLYSQGSGACFEGNYSYRKGSVKLVEEHASLDIELHRIVTGLYEIQKRYFFGIEVGVKRHGNYPHKNATEIHVCGKDGRGIVEVDELSVKELLRDFVDWIYSRLCKTDEWINSNEYIDEGIIANEYTFTVDGIREG